ncbi:MAG: hypothetical protein ACI4NE_04375 [Succinivibrio sp.]
MEEKGLTRIPYYSELHVFDRDNVNNDILSLVLSVMLYWHSRDRYHRFNAREHLRLLSRNLRRPDEKVLECLEYAAEIGILNHEKECFTTQSENPDKREKINDFYSLNFHNLHEQLKAKGICIPVKILRLASDDYFDLYAYLSPKRMPLVQGLVGQVKGEEYEMGALNACKIICGICEDSEFEDFSYKALAPGWRMLAQPPASAEDVVERYLREGERSVDVDLMDGSFFMPDGNYFGTEIHKIWHSGKKTEPRILAAALYLGFTAVSKDVSFYSDLNLAKLKPGFELLYRFTGLKGVLTAHYFDRLDLHGEDREKAQKEYESILDSL